MQRKIIHVDMDAYFAAVEIREHPELRGKCVIVGGNPNGRGVVSTCSYEARKFGVHSGMSSHQAWKLCPQAVFVHSTFGIYKEITAQIREIFARYTDIIEPMSLDEAYLDVTENKIGEADPVVIARRIKQEVLETTRLTCSAGVSYNKFLAKIGSDLEKPDGLVFIPPERAQEILFSLPIGKFHGIGRVTAARMQKLGIMNGADLFKWELKDLLKRFGKVGMFYYQVVRGIDNRELITYWEPKSISCEHTFDKDISSIDELLEALKSISQRLAGRMLTKSITGSSIVLKLKYDNFEYITRICPLPQLTNDPEILYKFGQQLLVSHWDSSRQIRLLGLGVNKLATTEAEENQQLTLF
ncbi:MAG TPA: DNA polymerase IV [Candidatus Cloacimonadota bacterium]|nr:DNA polymerase IV [Candidatus Cloacimonadota bacterium]